MQARNTWRCDFFCHRLNRPGRIAVSLPSKNYQSRWNPCGNMNIIEILWSVNLQRCIIITLSGNCCFLSLMVRYCPQKSNIVMRYDWCHKKNSKLNTGKKVSDSCLFRFPGCKFVITNYIVHRLNNTIAYIAIILNIHAIQRSFLQ